MPRVPNPRGKNQHGDKEWPPDDELEPELCQYAREQLTIKEKQARFLKRFGMSIGKTSLCGFNKKFSITSSRKPPPRDYCAQLILTELDNDPRGRRGVEAVRTNLRIHQEIIIPRQIIRDVLAANQPDQAVARVPGHRQPRKALRAIGPDHQHHSDGWEKLGAQALNMGGVGIPAYATKDQYSSRILQARVLPSSRLQAVQLHVYLDRVAANGGIPITEVTDLGSEHGDVTALCSRLRAEFAPDLSQETAPAQLGLSSTKNTPIEGNWHCLRQYAGHNLHDAITIARDTFDGNCRVQRLVHLLDYWIAFWDINEHKFRSLFYWIWPRVVQAALDDFVEYWNCHRIPTQKNKANPSGVTPNHAYICPDALNPPGRHCLISVPHEYVEEIRSGLQLSREQAFAFVSASFHAEAKQVYDTLSAPPLTVENAWEVFDAMLPHLLRAYPARDPEPAYVFTL